MTAYIDTSALLRLVLREAGALDELRSYDSTCLERTVLSRAGEPLPTPLGTLDAVHLATALIWRDRMGSLPIVATHDAALGLAARAFGFEVRGL